MISQTLPHNTCMQGKHTQTLQTFRRLGIILRGDAWLMSTDVIIC